MSRYVDELKKIDQEFALECQHVMNHSPSVLPSRTVSGSIKTQQEPALPPLVAEKSILICDE